MAATAFRFGTLPVVAPARNRRILCKYRRDTGDREDRGQGLITVYTSCDVHHGGISPESQAVLMCLLEKKVPFQEVKASCVDCMHAGHNAHVSGVCRGVSFRHP